MISAPAIAAVSVPFAVVSPTRVAVFAFSGTVVATRRVRISFVLASGRSRVVVVRRARTSSLASVSSPFSVLSSLVALIKDSLSVANSNNQVLLSCQTHVVISRATRV